jgi:hypothetical protein
MCPGTELNRRHEDFQSSALPTELPGLKRKMIRKNNKDKAERLIPYLEPDELIGKLPKNQGGGLLQCEALVNLPNY